MTRHPDRGWWDGSVRHQVQAVRARLLADDRARDRTSAAATWVVGVVFLMIGLTDLWPDLADAPESVWWHAAPLTVGAAAMLIKRRRPALALAVGVGCVIADACLGGSVGMIFVLFDLLFAAALGGSPALRRGLVAGVAAMLGATFVLTQAQGEELRVTVLLLIQVFAILGTPLWWAANVRQSAELASAAALRADLERARAADLEQLALLRQDELVRDERTRMARELHDVIAGDLTSIAINAEAALAGPVDPLADREALRQVRRTGIHALEEMRSMIVLLRSGAEPLTSAAGLSRLDELVRTAKEAGMEIDVVRSPPDGLPAAVDQAAFRIIQESLTNAAKHARACGVRVDVAVTGSALELTIENELRRPETAPPTPERAGADAPVRGGSGLTIMRERAEALGGTFAAGPSADDGAGVDRRCWRVHARLPVDVPR
jgi:signal transduction histidine kinase